MGGKEMRGFPRTNLFVLSVPRFPEFVSQGSNVGTLLDYEGFKALHSVPEILVLLAGPKGGVHYTLNPLIGDDQPVCRLLHGFEHVAKRLIHC
jgi:hypothetical protein